MSEQPAHEKSDANPRAILWTAGGLVVAVLVIHVSIVLYEFALSRLYPSPSRPAFVTKPVQEVPAPRLQSSPRRDWEVYRATSEATLSGYGWIDRANGITHLPIQRAMQLTAERGLPARSPAPKGDQP